MIDIHLRPEYVLYIGGFGITNTYLTSVLVSAGLMLFAVYFYRHREQNNLLFDSLRVMVFRLYGLCKRVTGEKNFARKLLPLVATFFLFIVSMNLLALLPGFLGSFYVQTPEKPVPLLRSPNSDLTTTLGLACFSIVAIQYFSLRELGWKEYLLRFFDFTGPIHFVMGFFELISMATKTLSMAFRLFGNIFAGEILLLVIGFLVPYFIPLPFMILEIFVGIIQAFIFAVLTLTFAKTSTVRFLEET